MARAASPKGTCRYCGKEITRRGAVRHLEACPERRAVVEAAAQGKGGAETLYHLRVRDAWSGEYWLDLEVRGASTLAALDSYLRRIWLECCGHMSRFSIGGWGGREIGKSRKINAAFEGGAELTHIYDFGTESVTRIQPVGTRRGTPTTRSHPIALMARNSMPEAGCAECERPAAWLCRECMYEEDATPTLCDDHARTHPHDEYGDPVPLVNSPRVGMCGYEGPAEPPY